MSETIKFHNRLVTYSGKEFLARDFPAEAFLVWPWMAERSVSMIAGYRGIGKTFLSMSVAYAIAGGGGLLGWHCPTPTPILYIDGEMDRTEFQKRLRMIDTAARMDGNGNPDLALENLRILSHAEQERGIPDLSDPDGDGRRRVEDALVEHGSKAGWFDNLSCLCRSGTENEAESWGIMQEWLNGMRSHGYTIALDHHTGKPRVDGTTVQRGTSKKEDIMNTSILLGNGRPGGFSLTYSKARSFEPPDEAMQIQIEIVADRECRLKLKGEDSLEAEVLKLYRDGLSMGDIAVRTGMNKGSISRIVPQDEKRPRGAPKGNQHRTGTGKQQQEAFDCAVAEIERDWE